MAQGVVGAVCLMIIWWSFVGFGQDLLRGLGPLASATIRYSGPKGRWETELADPAVLASIDADLRDHRSPAAHHHFEMASYRLTLRDASDRRTGLELLGSDDPCAPAALRHVLRAAESSGFAGWRPAAASATAAPR